MKEASSIGARAGAEIRVWREALDMPQQSVANLFGWKRDAVSKIETGKNEISLHDYIMVVRFLQAAVPEDHPALALADQLMKRRFRRA